MRLLLPCSLVIVTSALACSSGDGSPADGTAAEDVQSAFACELVSGAESRDFSGDGEPRRIELRRRPEDRDRMDANLLGEWDLAQPSSRGLPRECERATGTSTEDIFVCRAEPEWDHFETTSTLRAPVNAFDRGAPFQLVYHSARDNDRVLQGFSEWTASKRVFACKR